MPEEDPFVTVPQIAARARCDRGQRPHVDSPGSPARDQGGTQLPGASIGSRPDDEGQQWRRCAAALWTGQPGERGVDGSGGVAAP